MKKIFFGFLMLALFAGVAQAQKPGKLKMKEEKEKPFQKLNLSDDQKAKYKSINEDFRKQMEDLRKNEDITVKEWKAKREKLQQDHMEKMKAVLTEDQKAQINKMKEDRKSRMMQRDEKRFDMMKERLALTDDQSSKIKSMHSETAEKLKAIHENKSLSIDQKKEQSKELMKQNKEKMKSILSEEQMKKLKDRKDKSKNKHKHLI